MWMPFGQADVDNILTCVLLTFSFARLRKHIFPLHQFDLPFALNVVESQFSARFEF